MRYDSIVTRLWCLTFIRDSVRVFAAILLLAIFVAMLRVAGTVAGWILGNIFRL